MGQITLNAAIYEILKARNAPMSTKEIARENELRELYRKGDNSFPSPSQISARVNKRPEAFERRGKLISLKEWSDK